ncbi:MAG: hypothetical protein Q8L48_26400 [Archangium sp.]|nr:hypothetical protein [Archangium sp.]
MRTIFRVAVSSCLLTTLLACPPPPTECIDGTEPVCDDDAGALPPDFCNSADEAVSDSVNCHLTITTGGAMPAPKSGVFISRLVDGGIDQDWYFAQAPGGLTARSLLHVRGGYTAPQTAVNFQVNVLKEGDGGLLSVTTAIDKHGPAAPKPIDVIVPFSESNARLFALVNDEGISGQVRVDNRNTYSLFMEIIDNPDVNEPNDTTPTAIALTTTGAIQDGSQTGYLATNDDVDQFSFPMTSAGRQVIYLHILGPDPHPMNPPPPYKLSYTLFDPSDRPIAEGVMANEFLRIDLATARLATMTGTYRVEVKGFKPPTSTLPIRGDLDLRYTVNVQIMPDLDTQEGAGGNDTAMTARVISISPNGSTSLTGKLSYVADEEWFVLSLPSRSTPSTLRYRVTAAAGGGRFAPLSGTPARQLRITKRVTAGATAQDRQVACRTSPAACAKSDTADKFPVNELCNASDPPQCLYAQRNEELPRIPLIRNLVGALPVFQNQPVELLIMFRDEGVGASKYADDRDWTIDLDWVDDGDEAARVAGPTVIGLSGTTSVAQGELTYGYGKVFDVDQWFMRGGGLRGLNDYDAYDTDKDLFQFNFGGAVGDQGWELSWDLLHADGGMRPAGDIALEFTFCGAGPVPDGGLCAGSQTRIFGYSDQSLTPWYLPQSASNGRTLFTRTSTASSTTITALPVACTCFSAARTSAGVYYANIAAIDRVENDPIRYRISQRIAPYPGNFTGPDGGSASCPVGDGGCGFAR